MGTRRPTRSPTARRGRHLPEYALKVRELRDQCGLTQPELASELGTTRGAIAKWEGAEREPSEQNYTKLLLLARQRKLKTSEEFFCGRVFAIIRDREYKLDDADARRFITAVEDAVPAGELERVIEFSKKDRKQYIRDQVQSVIEARETLSNGAMIEAFTKIVFDTFYVEQLRKPGGIDAFRRIKRLERDLERFYEVGKTGTAEGEKAQHGIILQIINGWIVAALEGKVPDHGKLEGMLAEKNLLGVTLAKISGVMAAKAGALREGKPYDDRKFADDLKAALGMGLIQETGERT